MTESQKQLVLDHFDLGTSWLKEKEFIIISGAWIVLKDAEEPQDAVYQEW